MSRAPSRRSFLRRQPEKRRRELDVRLFPRVVKLAFDFRSVGGSLLVLQALPQAVEGPAVVWMARQIVAIDGLGFLAASGAQEDGAENVPCGEDQVGRFHIGEGVFVLRGFA